MTQENKRSIVDKYIEAYNAYAISAITQYLHPDLEYKHMTGNKVESSTKGVDAFAELAAQTKEVFATREQTITEYTESGDDVSIMFDYKAELAIDLPNGLKAGETLTLQGQSVLTFEADKIVKIIDKS